MNTSVQTSRLERRRDGGITHRAGRLLCAAPLLALGLSVSQLEARTRVVVALGDSITEGYRVSDPYPAQLGRRLGETVANEGVGGETSYRGLSRIEGVITSRQATHILIMFGANDVIHAFDMRGTASRIGEMAAIAKRHNVVPILATVTPFTGARAALNPTAQDLNSRIRRLATDAGYKLADVGRAFGNDSSLFQSDGFHPNNAGMHVIADTFFPFIGVPLPAKTTAISPVGEITVTRRPMFSWNAAEDATWYQVRIYRDTVLYHSQWVQSTSWTPTFDFPYFFFQWQVQTWNASGTGPDSDLVTFRYNGPDAGPPGAIRDMVAQPTGGGVVDYFWTADPQASRYHLWTSFEGGQTWQHQWHETGRQQGQIRITVRNHPMGDFKWWVQGEGIDGPGPWSGEQAFEYGEAAPTAPMGDLLDAPTVFTWDDGGSGDATWYRIRLSRDGVPHWDRWIKREDTTLAVGGTRSYGIPSTVAFPQGHYTWWVHTWNALGYGPESDGVQFVVPPRIPGVTTLTGPTGVLRDNRRPMFGWTAVEHASWYYLSILRNGAVYRNTWLQGATSWQSAEPMPLGNYAWSVRTWSIDGYGPISDTSTLTLLGNTPDASTPLGPLGVVAGTLRPVFTWSADTRATWYRLWVNRDGGVKFVDQWFQGATTWAPDRDLPPGAYRWWVQTWASDGYGPWSAPAEFTVAAPVP